MKKNDEKYKKSEKLLFCALRRNGRISLTELSNATRIPISTLYERMRGYSKSLIKKYTVLLDFTKLGYPVRIHFFLKVPKNKKEALFLYFINHHNVNNVYRINNGYDFFCEAHFEDMRSAECFLNDLEEKYKVTKLQTFYILEELKREEFFTTPNLLPDQMQ